MRMKGEINLLHREEGRSSHVAVKNGSLLMVRTVTRIFASLKSLARVLGLTCPQPSHPCIYHWSVALSFLDLKSAAQVWQLQQVPFKQPSGLIFPTTSHNPPPADIL